MAQHGPARSHLALQGNTQASPHNVLGSRSVSSLGHSCSAPLVTHSRLRAAGADPQCRHWDRAFPFQPSSTHRQGWGLGWGGMVLFSHPLGFYGSGAASAFKGHMSQEKSIGLEFEQVNSMCFLTYFRCANRTWLHVTTSRKAFSLLTREVLTDIKCAAFF